MFGKLQKYKQLYISGVVGHAQNKLGRKLGAIVNTSDPGRGLVSVQQEVEKG